MGKVIILLCMLFAFSYAYIESSDENINIIDHESSDKSEDAVQIIKSSTIAKTSKLGTDLDGKKNKINYRLPSVIEVDKYKIRLATYLDEDPTKNFVFDGVVLIDFTLKNEVKNITLHSKDLTITSLELKTNNQKIKPLTVQYEPETEFLIIYPSKKLKPGDYSLKIRYNGKLQDLQRGLYRTSYVNEMNETKWFAVTMFSPVSARRAFPCFDEPRYKAVFDFSINHHENYSALFNTKVKSKLELDSEGRVQTSFEPTPRVSTYTLAFIVSDFLSMTNDENNHSLYTKASDLQNGKFAMDIESKIYKKLEEFFEIPLEQKKIDLVAVPDYFYDDAIESWGLLLFNDYSLLNTSSDFAQSEIEMFIEDSIIDGYARQWFGGMVTHDWWKDYWLTEGFANIMWLELSLRNELIPSEAVNFLIHWVLNWELSQDSDEDSVPVVKDVESPEDIEDRVLEYWHLKATCVVRMLKNILTDEIFKKGIRNYLNKNKYSTVESNDLYEAIEETIKDEKYKLPYPLKSIMESWVNFKGYPILNVVRDYGTKTLFLNQERLITYNATEEEKNDPHTWYIPINMATQASPDFESTATDFWMKDREMSMPIQIDADNWILLNKQQTGFYRVNYDDRNWKLITDYLKTSDREKIHPLNRAQLLADALIFYQQDLLNIQTLLQLTEGLSTETDTTVWLSGSDIISWLDTKLINTKFYSKLMKVISKISEKMLDVIMSGQINDITTEIIGEDIIQQACRAGNQNILNSMQQKLEAWLEDSYEVTPSERPFVFYCGLRNVDSGTWKKVYEKALSELNDIEELSEPESEKYHILEGLAATATKNQLINFLNHALKNETSSFDLDDVFIYIFSHSPVGVDVILDFLLANKAEIIELMGTEEEYHEFLYEILEGLAEMITTENEYTKLKKLLDSDAPESILVNAEKNIKWLKDNEEILAEWLEIEY